MVQTNPGDDTIPANEATPEATQQSESEESDEQLMLDFAAGQSDAFGTLFNRYKQPLFGFFRRRLADAAQAEELTQETFIAVLRCAPRYQPSARFRTFLYSIAMRILRAHRRKAAFRATFFGEQPAGREPASHSDPVVDLLMREAVASLDRIDREVLMLREFEELSYAEIAEVLALPINTVRSRLFRARTALHDLLGAPAPSRPSNAPAAEVRA
jgi:RNA polymerase sigma-70 factor (ECF subfamily)